ncbi:hypothetical protein OK016_04865 [Vibrio chagasii]|nr:hypothetical protein [Vibrio chagasii]
MAGDFEIWRFNHYQLIRHMITWQQEINETGVRKKASLFQVNRSSCESYGEKNTYYIGCVGMDSAEFGTSSERWFL